MIMIHTISSLFESKVDPLTEIIDADSSSNFSTPSFCRSVASGCRTPDVDDEDDIDGNEGNCGNDDDDSPKSAEAILISPINRPHFKDFDESNSMWKLDESMDFKNLVIANLSPFRTRKLKAVSVSLFENHADIFPDKQSAAGIDKQKTTYRSTEDSNIDLHEVYADAKYIHKIDEGAIVEESSKSKSVVFRFDEFFVAISGYVFLLFAVFTALFMYRMQSSAWATGGDGSVKLGGFCSSCAMEQLQKSFYYPITSTAAPPSMLSTSILRDQPSGASIRSKNRNTSLRDSNINSNEFTYSKPFSESTSLSTIKIIWMNIFFVLKDSTQPTSLFQDTTGTTFTSMRGRKPTAGVYDGEKGANTTTIRDPGSNVGEKHRHPKASTDHIPTVPLSIDLLPKEKNAGTQVVKIDKEKSRKENRSHLSKLLEKKKEKPTTTELSTATTSSVSRAGTGQLTGLKRVLNGIKGAANRVVQGVKKFFQKNAKYTNILLAVGVYLILLA